MDLQLLNQKAMEKALPSNGNAAIQGAAFSSQSVEENQNLPPTTSTVFETESSERTQQLGERVDQETREQDNARNGGEDKEKSSTASPVSRDVPSGNRYAESVERLYSSRPRSQELTNQPRQPEVELQQTQPLETSPKQTFNRLMQSHLQQPPPKAPPSPSIAATDDRGVENSIALFERWQRLILTQEIMDAREAIAKFKKQLESLEYQIYEPKELTNLLLPLMTEILTLKVTDAGEEVACAIAPLVDEMIRVKAQQDKVALGSALAPVLPEAVAQHIHNSPGELARALGPEMGPAIKEQINLERDAMVDALYPVIGSTISKYMAEAIRTINEKVENALSLEGVSRKIRAKLQGVSEAELIFREAIPFHIQAIFLIHKASGLVISEIQPSDSQHLESEMVAGMLTAIRSFANDCMAQSGDVSEIDEIDYGNSKIVLEVAGYYYLAVVIQGYPPKSFNKKMRRVLGAIVQSHGKAIALFDGDPANVPEEINQILQELTKLNQTSTEEQNKKPPIALLLVSLTVLITTSLTLGIYQYRRGVNQRVEAETNLALASEPELAVYRLGVKANSGTIKLSGKLPNPYLRSKAEQIAKTVEPKWKVNNAIIPVEVPPDPIRAEAEVKRVTKILNQMEGTLISADYREGNVTVKGVVLQDADANKITEAFLQIPGVKSVANTVQLQPLAIVSRVYFERGSAEISATERSKVLQIRAFLEQHPTKYLKLIGHTDPKGTDEENEPLALERAKAVRDALVSQGVDAKRLQVEGTTDPPLGVDDEQVPLLGRAVEFEIITP